MKNAEAFAPLNEAELQELDRYLLYEVDSDEAMTLDMADGFLHAIAVGPTTIHPAQWLPKIFGGMPPVKSQDQLNHVIGLIMRHYNGIITGLEFETPEMMPVWSTLDYLGETYEDGEDWAYGFFEGMRLCWSDWMPMLDTEEGQAWLRPLGLLGEEDFDPDQDELTETPTQRADLTAQIPDAVLSMYLFWLPYRHAIHEREVAKAMQPKVGRNDPCPCGSGKKFKKCCGAAGTLH